MKKLIPESCTTEEIKGNSICLDAPAKWRMSTFRDSVLFGLRASSTSGGKQHRIELDDINK